MRSHGSGSSVRRKTEDVLCYKQWPRRETIPGPYLRRPTMRDDVLQGEELVAQLKNGQKVVTEHDEIGDVVGLEYSGNAAFVHVRRYGPGLDDLYIPVI